MRDFFYLTLHTRYDNAAWRTHGRLLVRLMFAGLVLLAPLVAFGKERQPALVAGPEIGSTVASFYVRAVTGPLAGKSVCYVCRNGDRPVVMVFLRNLGPDAGKLLKQLDVTINKHRADGLRCFVVLFSESTQRDAARLQTLAFDEKLDIPLTVATEALAGSTTKNIGPDAEITVVLYDHLKVTDRFSYRAGECDDEACAAIVKSAERMARQMAE
jgi:hypothetical protein